MKLINKYLAANKKDEESDGCPYHLFTKLDLSLRFGNFRQDAAERLDDFQEFDCKKAKE